MSTDSIEHSFAWCRRTTRRHARSFFFASHALPAEKRAAAYAVYAFCRYADNIIDEAGESAGATASREEIGRLRTDLGRLYAGSLPPGPFMPALKATIERYALPREYFLDLLTGVEMDLSTHEYRTFEDLRRYCYHVASVVGLIMARILGASENDALDAAADLGLGMQLTNILRDIAEDRDRGRCYIPGEEMDRFGYTSEDLKRGDCGDRFVALMQFQIERAHRYYRQADRGIAALPDDGSRFCVTLMSRTYEAILDVIEENTFDVFSGRASTSLPRKLGIAGAALLGRGLHSRRHSGPLRPTATHPG